MNVIYFPNLAKSQTGTVIGAKYCADVAVQGVTGLTVKETRYHDAASAGINSNVGAFVALGSGSALASNISKIQITSTIGEPLTFRIGADAAAADLASDLFILNRGDGPITLDLSISIASKLWVRSLTNVAVTDGIITVNLLG